MKTGFKSLKRAVIAASIVSLSGTSAAAGIEEIVVTATKRSESVQDVGLSVQAFDETLLQQGGITDVSRLELMVSGVNYAFVGNDAKFNVRGANSSNTFGDAASIVGTFVDGVYKPRASQQSRAFYDIDRVEFLKGPQGTLYGRNTFAGALNLHTKAASLDEGFSGYFNLGFESYDATKVEGAINLPVSDTFALRIAAVSNKSDGYIKNLAGPDIGAQDDRSFRLSATFYPNESMDWTLRIQRSEEDGREAGLFGYTFICRGETANGLTDPFGSAQNCANPVRGSGGIPDVTDFDPAYTISQDYAPEVDLVEETYSLEGNIDFGDLSLKTITNYTDFQNLFGFDFDFSPNPNSIGGYDETLESFSQEFNLSSNFDGPVNFTSGLYYSSDEHFASFSIYQRSRRDDSTRPTAANVLDANDNRLFAALNSRGNPTTGLTLVNTGFDPILLSGTPLVHRDLSFGGYFADSAFVESDTLGVYGEAEWAISEELRLTLGFRYSEEDKSLDGAGDNFSGDTNGDGTVDRVVNVVLGFDAGASPVIIPDSRDVFTINRNASDAVSIAEKYDNLTYRIGLEYDLDQDSLVYGTVSTGFLSGALSVAGGATDEQESTVYEIGYKGFLLDNSLKFNAALHYTEYDNLLAQLQREVAGIVVTESRNGGVIEAKGIELELVYVPTDELTLGSNISLLDSEYGTFGANNPYQLWNGQIQSFIDLNGEKTPWSPDFTISLFGSYRIDLGDNGSITPYIQTYFSDGYNTSNIVGTDPNQQQDSFSKTDMRITWEDAEQRYSIEVFVENLEDEAVLARGNNNSDDLVQTGFLYPRNSGVRFRAKF